MEANAQWAFTLLVCLIIENALSQKGSGFSFFDPCQYLDSVLNTNCYERFWCDQLVQLTQALKYIFCKPYLYILHMACNMLEPKRLLVQFASNPCQWQ